MNLMLIWFWVSISNNKVYTYYNAAINKLKHWLQLWYAYHLVPLNVKCVCPIKIV